MIRPGTPSHESGPLLALDRALEVARSRSLSELLKAWAPGVGLSLLAIALYYAERVEGVRSLRPFFAFAFAAGYTIRAVVLSRWASRRVDELLAPYDVAEEEAQPATAARASLWIGFDLWLWLWLLVIAVHLDAWLVPLVLPTLAARGALAPSWLACAGKSKGATGFGAVRRGVEHAEGQRMLGVSCELLLLLAALGFAFNLGAIATLGMGVAQDILGLDLAFVRAFLSPRNHFALLVIASASLTVLEPVRAALSAVLFTDSLLTREGVAVRSLVERSTTAKRRAALGRVAALLIALLGVSASARAEDPESAGAQDAGALDMSVTTMAAPSEEEAPEPPCDEACLAARGHDTALKHELERILREPRFAEFPDDAWDVDELGKGALESWLERFLRWLFARNDDAAPPPGAGLELGHVPGATFFLVVAAALVTLVLVRWLSGQTREPRSEAEPEPVEDPFAQPAESHLDEARRLASSDLALALRSLYLATLVGLERRNLLRLSPERTNGQYLRELPPGHERKLFGTLTRVFDAVHYGARTPTREDFETCRAIAESLVQDKAGAT